MPGAACARFRRGALLPPWLSPGAASGLPFVLVGKDRYQRVRVACKPRRAVPVAVSFGPAPTQRLDDGEFRVIGWAAFLAAQAAQAADPAGVLPSSPSQSSSLVLVPVPEPAAPVAAVSNVSQSGAPPASAIPGVDDLLTAEVWLTQNRVEDARRLLLALEKQPSAQQARVNQVQFLLGLLDMHDQAYVSAISRFRRILVSQPNMVRVRLELGRAYFLGHHYADAERQFLYARAGKLPVAVRVNIDRYLGQIREQKSFGWGFSLAMAPDSNLNAGPAIDAVTLYGLPFQLSRDAKANSGVGLVLDANAEWAPRLTRRLKWRIGGQLHRTQYGATTFDDMSVSGYSGPHLTLRRWDINLLGNIARRWYGEAGYSLNYGPSLDATYYLSARLGVGGNGSLSQTDYDQNPGQSGMAKTLGLYAFYTPTTSSYVRGAVTFGHQGARDGAFAFNSWQYGINYVREFSGGITLGVAPAFTQMDYDAPLLAFGKIRHDRQLTGQISLLDRRLSYHGMTPRISYTYTRADSDIALYSFNRHHFEIGITKTF